jgi:hypothetical protein
MLNYGKFCFVCPDPATSLFENGRQNITDQTGVIRQLSEQPMNMRRGEKCAVVQKNAEERVDMDGAREKIENNITNEVQSTALKQ